MKIIDSLSGLRASSFCIIGGIYDEEKEVAALYVETAKEMIRKIKEQLGD